MSPTERVAAIGTFGFSKRQSRFLDIVMRHAGVCLLRQYTAFAGIAHGQKTRAFFLRLVRRGYASSHRCRHNRGRIYHVHHHALYSAIGEPNSRCRRPVSARRTPERLMLLDAVLAGTDITWFATRNEVRNHFTSLSSDVASPMPLVIGRDSSPVDGLPGDTLRIGIDPSGRTVLLYLAVPSDRADFRTLLERLAQVLSGVPAWTLRLVYPGALAHAYESYQRVVREEWTPLPPHIIDELDWYFGQRRSLPHGRFPCSFDARFERASITFDGPRFDRLYRRWLRRGAAALSEAVSPVISDALTNGSGRVESLILGHAYEHLSPVIDGRGNIAVAGEQDTDSLTMSQSLIVGSAAHP